MAKRFHTVFAFIMAMALTVGVLTVSAGCTPGKTGKQAGGTANQSGKPGSSKKPTDEKKPVTLTYFWDMDGKATMSMKSYAEIACLKEAEEKTGVHIDWLHPPGGKAGEQFQSMLSSQNLPDMMYWNWRHVSGGPAKALEDSTILALNDIIDKHAPNFKAVLAEHPEWKKEVSLDDGSVYMFPFIRGDEFLRVTGGFAMRKDWLDKLGLNVPQTIDDWYNVLSAFKKNDMNNDGNSEDELPYVCDSLGGVQNFSSAWGLRRGAYLSGVELKYGFLQPEYRDFLTTMAKWYAEGLIDDSGDKEAKMTGSLGGSYYGAILGNFGRFTQLARESQPDFTLVGVPYPKGPAGISYSPLEPAVQDSGTAITPNCKHVKEAAEYLDYGYGKDGHMAFNFGKEGESYTMKDGEPIYMDTILHNPKLPVANALIRYALSISSGSFVQDVRYMKQNCVFPEQEEALHAWIDGSDPSLQLPPSNFTTAESEKFNELIPDINSYADDMITKFIKGEESLDNFDQFVGQIKKLHIDEVIKLQQAALDRYNAR